MVNGCVDGYVKLLMCSWTFFFTVYIKHWSPPADQRVIQRQQKIEQTRHLWRPGLHKWCLLKGRRVPAPLQCCTLRMLEQRLMWNHPRKALFKIKMPLWSAESTSVSITPHDWGRRASATGWHRWCRRQRRLRAATTGDLTVRGYCSFQVTKCDKKVTSVSYRPHCVKHKPPVFNLLTGRFWGFSLHRGDTLHQWGWNLAWSPSSVPNFTPISATIRV